MFKLIEQREGFEERWLCDPPAEGVPYIVLRSQWDDDYTVRTILEVTTDVATEPAPCPACGFHARWTAGYWVPTHFDLCNAKERK